MATQSVKDILNTEIPSPSFVLSPSVAAPLPSGVTHTRNGRDNVARTLDPYSGKFKQVAEDTPRVYGSDQSLLVEAAGRTNQVPDSSDVSQWSTEATDISVGSSYASIIDEEAANALSATSGVGNAFKNVGTFSNGQELAYLIAEKGTSSLTGIVVRNTTNSSTEAFLEYDWGDSSFTNKIGLKVNARTISTNAPARGNEVVRLQVRYDSSGSSGDNRELRVQPDRNGNGNEIVFHHAQLEEAPNASSPIVTEISAKTRAADSYKIFDYSNDPDQDHPDWYNVNQGTIFIELEELTNYGFYSLTNGTFRITRGADRENWYFTDGGNNISVDGSSLKTKIAASFNSTERVLSVNGTSNTTSTTQIFDFDSSIFYFGDIPSNLIKRFVYFPRALSESTINTLTS